MALNFGSMGHIGDWSSMLGWDKFLREIIQDKVTSHILHNNLIINLIIKGLSTGWCAISGHPVRRLGAGLCQAVNGSLHSISLASAQTMT